MINSFELTPRPTDKLDILLTKPSKNLTDVSVTCDTLTSSLLKSKNSLEAELIALDTLYIAPVTVANAANLRTANPACLPNS